MVVTNDRTVSVFGGAGFLGHRIVVVPRVHRRRKSRPPPYLNGAKIAPPRGKQITVTAIFRVRDTVRSAKIVFGRLRSEIPATEGAAVWWFNG